MKTKIVYAVVSTEQDVYLEQVALSAYSLRQHVEGDFLFIDSDTIVTDSLQEVDTLTGSVMMVLDYHVSLEQRFNAKSVKRRLKSTGVTFDSAMPYYNSLYKLYLHHPRLYAFFNALAAKILLITQPKKK